MTCWVLTNNINPLKALHIAVVCWHACANKSCLMCGSLKKEKSCLMWACMRVQADIYFWVWRYIWWTLWFWSNSRPQTTHAVEFSSLRIRRTPLDGSEPRPRPFNSPLSTYRPRYISVRQTMQGQIKVPRSIKTISRQIKTSLLRARLAWDCLQQPLPKIHDSFHVWEVL